MPGSDQWILLILTKNQHPFFNDTESEVRLTAGGASSPYLKTGVSAPPFLMKKPAYLLSIFITIALVLMACGTSTVTHASHAQVAAIAQKVAAHYGEPNPQITHLYQTVTEATPRAMSIIILSGHFQKGDLTATGLEFSALDDGSKVWALSAFTASNSKIWVDDTVSLAP